MTSPAGNKYIDLIEAVDFDPSADLKDKNTSFSKQK